MTKWQITRLLSLGLVISTFHGTYTSCGGSSSGGGAGHPPVFVPPDRRPKEEFNLQSLNVDRLLRRVTLDLTGRLPKTSDRTYVSGSLTRLIHLAGIYTRSDEFAQHFSRIHRHIWQLDSSYLPDIERFIAEGDTSLNNALDGKLRQRLIEEPLNMVRFITANEHPFERLFSSGISLIHPDVASFWGMDTQPLEIGNSDLLVGRYQDSRPDIGVLAQQGFLAGISNSNQSSGAGFNFNLLSRLLCNDFHATKAHDFSELSDSEISNINTTKRESANCAGCHLQLEGTTSTLRSFNQGTTFGTWAAFTSPSTVLRGHYAAQDFVGLSELASLIASDPRVHRCHLQRLAEVVQQRQFTYPQDVGSISILVETFNRHNRTFSETMRALVSLEDYKLAPIQTPLESSALEHLSGKRFLTSNHWHAIISQWGFDSADFPVTQFLDPGRFDHLTQTSYHPSAPYWHASNKLARHIAHAIVTRELANQTLASSRRLLRDLPDGHSAGTQSVIVHGQITKLWNELTGDRQTVGDEKTTNLYQLWSTIENDAATASKTREAWQTVIVAILLSPEFISY